MIVFWMIYLSFFEVLGPEVSYLGHGSYGTYEVETWYFDNIYENQPLTIQNSSEVSYVRQSLKEYPALKIKIFNLEYLPLTLWIFEIEIPLTGFFLILYLSLFDLFLLLQTERLSVVNHKTLNIKLTRFDCQYL